MKAVTNLLVVCGLALAAPACKEDRSERREEITPKAVEEAEKDAVEERQDVLDEADDVAKAKAELNEQRQDVAEEKAEANRKRDEFVAKARVKMNELDTRIDAIYSDFRANTATLKAESRQELDKLMTKLEQQRAKARAAFDEAAHGTVDGWHQLEQNTGEVLDDLEETADDAVDELKEAGVKLRTELRDRD